MTGRRGFIRLIILVALSLIGLVGALSVREFPLPEMRGLNEPTEALIPPVPAGIRRPDVIHVHDTLAVHVAGEPELTGEFTVDEGGEVQLPMTGAFSVEGLTSPVAAARLSARLADGFLMEPVVAIDVRHSEFQTVFVLGQVNRPQAVTVAGPLALKQATVLAGGPTVAAGHTVLVVRPPDRATTPTAADDHVARKFTLDLDRDAAENLRDGDTLFVRPAGVFFVLGEVNVQGVYVLQPGMTVAQALTIAGGLTEDGSTRGIKISRLAGAKRIELNADDTTALASSDIVRVRRRFFR